MYYRYSYRFVCLQAALPTDIFAFNFTVERNISEVEDTLRSVLAEQLGVRSIKPLLCLYTYKCSYYYWYFVNNIGTIIYHQWRVTWWSHDYYRRERFQWISATSSGIYCQYSTDEIRVLVPKYLKRSMQVSNWTKIYINNSWLSNLLHVQQSAGYFVNVKHFTLFAWHHIPTISRFLHLEGTTIIVLSISKH